MKIAIGTKNKNKIEATKKVLYAINPKIEVVSVDIKSLVSDQPLSEEETRQGAIHRAQESLKKTNADIGMGIEGGYGKDEYGFFAVNIAAAVNKKEEISIGGYDKFYIPEEVGTAVMNGEKLEHITSEYKNRNKMDGHFGGLIGLLTNGFLDRSSYLEQSIILALVRFWKQLEDN